MLKGLIASFNMLLDPASGAETARNEKWSWVLPLALLAIASAAVAWIIIPLTADIMLKNPPPDVAREQIEKSAEMIKKFGIVGVVTGPIMAGLMTAVSAGLILLMGTLMGMKTSFGEIFNLTAMASLVKTIHTIAMAVVLKIKGDTIETAEELAPAFGLDIFLPDETNKFVRAFFNYFSVFEIWHIIVLALGLAAMYKLSKGKAFTAVTLSWLFPLLLALVGVIFRK